MECALAIDVYESQRPLQRITSKRLCTDIVQHLVQLQTGCHYLVLFSKATMSVYPLLFL